MLKALFILLIPMISFANCPLTLQGVLDENTSGLLEKLQMPNCTEETHEVSSMCNCADSYRKFKKENSVKVVNQFKNETNYKREKDLSNGAKAKIVSMIYDLHYTDSMFSITEAERQKLTQEKGCNLNTFRDAVKNTCGNNSLINNENLNQMIEEFQNEGLLITSDNLNLQHKGFFDRSKNSCDISDAYLLNLKNYSALYELASGTSKRKEEALLQNPLGHYIKNLDKKVKVPKFKSIHEVKNFLSDNKEVFLESFGNKCQQNFKDAATVLCSDLTNSKISDDDFKRTANITPFMYYEDEGFLETQERISNFCQARSAGIDNFSMLKNLLQHGIKEEKISPKDEKQTIAKERQDLFKASETMQENFTNIGHEKMFFTSCQILSKNRPISKKKLDELKCDLKEFEKNFNVKDYKSDKNAAKRLQCPLLVLDYILNTPEEELVKQKVDKELISFKKESNEKSTSESKGSGLLTSFLSISKPETVAKFKAAGIDAKPTDNGAKTASNNSNVNSKANTNNAPQRNVMNVPQNNSNQVARNVQAPVQQAQSYAPQYSQTFSNLNPSERSQIQDIEKEIMRRLGTSNEKSQVERQRAEMYKNYSKELENLAKERKRLESSNNANPKEVASYDKKMQDLIDQMKAENQKLAKSSGNQNEVIQTGSSNNEKAQSFGTTRTASNANSFGSSSGATQNSIMNDATNKALNETVNRERFNELTGKKDTPSTTGGRNPAALETVNQKFALIENGRVIEISSIDDLINQKRSTNEPFIIAFKDSPTMRVEVVPTKQGYSFKPLGSLTNKEYRSFFMEVKMTLENEKQSFHREELQEQLGKIKN